jgi:hypothetical protein
MSCVIRYHLVRRPIGRDASSDTAVLHRNIRSFNRFLYSIISTVHTLFLSSFSLYFIDIHPHWGSEPSQ